MQRLVAVFLACWVAIGVWLCWGDLVGWLTDGSLFSLSVWLSFIYPLFALVPALVIAAVSGRLLGAAWWLRGPLGATVCCSIVLVFLTQTEQFDVMLVLVFAAVGFVLGVSAPRPQSRTMRWRQQPPRPAV